MKWQVTLCEPDIGEDEIEAVTNVLKSKWFTMGDVTEEFEKNFSEMIGCRYAFAVTNGTAALHLANVVLDLGPGDEVICPALTFVATANASRYTGADVIFADSISSQDLTVSPDDISRKITAQTKAISVVHYGGFPCHMDEILQIADEHHLKIIEDCSHAPLATTVNLNGNVGYVGTLGHVGCYSFFSNKNMTTGEGGMIITNEDELAEKIKRLRSHGMTSLTMDRHRGHTFGYDVVELGYNYRIDEIRSAIGIIQLKKLEKNNQRRRELFSSYCELLKNNDNVIIPFSDRSLKNCTPHIMPVIIRKQYDKIRECLRNQGIQTSKHYDLIPDFTLYQDSVFSSQVEHIENILTLPLYPGMTRENVKMIADIIDEVEIS